MSKSTAWGIASVSPAARRIAERAASRVGLTLEEWLDQAIAGHASSGLSPAREAVVGRAGEPGPSGGVQRPSAETPAFWPEAGSARDLQERLKLTTRPMDWGANRSEGNAERRTRPIEPVPDRAEAVSTRPVEPEPATRGLGSPSVAPPRPFDLESVLSEIVTRRRALDARQSERNLDPRPPLEPAQPPRGGLPQPRPGPDFRADRTPDGSAGIAAPPADEAPNTPADELRRGLRALSEKLDALRRQWSETKTDGRGFASLEDQIAAVRSSLPNLAPREAVAALEVSLGDLAQRVDGLDRAERGELREAIGGCDFKAAAADLERWLGAKLEALAQEIVRPEAIEPIRRQTEQLHALLTSAARRSVPFERFEASIADLGRRLEDLAAEHNDELTQAAEALAALRRQIEEGAAPAALASIERKLSEISSRLDREAARPPADAPELRDFGETAKRIDVALADAQSAARRVEASVDALNAKLEAPIVEPLAALMRDLSAKLEASELRERRRPPIESILSEIVEKLDNAPVTAAPTDSAALTSIDRELKSLRAVVAQSASPPSERLADELAERLKGRFGEAQALERAARDLMEELRGTDRAGGLAEAHAQVAEQVSALRRDRADAERRTEALLQGMQDVLNRLIDRLAGDDLDRSPSARRRDPASSRDLGARVVDPALLAALDDVAPRPQRPGFAAAGEQQRSASRGDAEDEILLEPGAGAPQRVRARDDSTDAVRSRTSLAVSAHIAAARRAAQSASAEDRGAKSAAGWPRVEKTMAHASRFYVRHRRALLLAAAIVLAVTAAARHIDAEGLMARYSRLGLPGAKPADALVLPPAAPSVDATPTGSIGRERRTTGSDSGQAAAPAPPELLAAIPVGAPAALREAVLAGSPPAEYELAQRLFEGHGLPQNQSAAASWFERAANAGFAPAAFRLGAMYQKGAGVARDAVAAKRWYVAAAQSGNTRAAHNLGVMDAEQVGEKADYAEAAKWFRRAAEMGVRDSQFNLAVLYARGLGVEQDLRRSWLWFSLAAAQGDAEAGRKRDEVAGKMDPGALAAAHDLLSAFKTTQPDPVANDVAATARNWGDAIEPAPPPSPHDQGSRSGS